MCIARAIVVVGRVGDAILAVDGRVVYDNAMPHIKEAIQRAKVTYSLRHTAAALAGSQSSSLLVSAC